MDFITGIRKPDTTAIRDILEETHTGTVKLTGAVHTIRDMGEIAFVILRKKEGLVQCIYEEGVTNFNCKELREGMTVTAEGIVSQEKRAPYGFEVHLNNISVLSAPLEDATLPIPIGKRKLATSLETKLTYRPISLRNIRERAIFKLQEGIVRGFRDFLFSQDFTEIRTPKIVAGNAEG